MKAVGVVMSVVAVLAGIVVARQELDREKTAGAGGPAASSGPAVGDAPDVTKEKSHVQEENLPGGDEAPGGEAPGSEGHADERTDVRIVTSPSDAAPSATVPSDDVRERPGQVERLLARQQFKRAAEMARDLIGALEQEGVSPSDETFVAARRLAAKANVFGLLVDNIERRETPRLASRVLLANGNTMESLRVEKDDDRYVLELPNGISYRPRLEEVREVLEMSPEEHRKFVAGEWRRLRKRLDEVKDPVDLYVRGVERCYRTGLVDEGLELLERLLTMPGSGTIPRRFAGAGTAAAVRDWEIAAGRPPEVPADTWRPESANPSRTRGDPRTGDDPASPRDVLVRVKSLRDEARRQYRRAFKGEGDGRDLRQARERLEEAFTLIESLGASEQVDELRLDLGQLLSDVVRVSPF